MNTEDDEIMNRVILAIVLLVFIVGITSLIIGCFN